MQNNGFGLTVKNTLRLLALFSVVFLFCPLMSISALGLNLDLDFSVMNVVMGMEVAGTKAPGSWSVLSQYVLIPVIMLILLFVKMFKDEGTSSVLLIVSSLDFLTWVFVRRDINVLTKEIMKSSMSEAGLAEYGDLLKNAVKIKFSVWFYLTLLVLLMIFVLSLMLVIGKAEMNSSITTIFNGNNVRQVYGQAQSTFNQMQTGINQMHPNMNRMPGSMPVMQQSSAPNAMNMNRNNVGGRICLKCGAAIPEGVKFCTTCGTPIAVNEPVQPVQSAPMKQEEPKVEAKAPQAADASAQPVSSSPVQPEAKMETPVPKMKFCRICGTKLSPDAVFCDACGTKVE